MNTTATNLGGWPARDMYTFLNTTIFNKLPDELKADGMILNTKTVSGYGNHEGETNYTSLNDKLYLLSYAEVWGANAAWDTVKLVSNEVTDGTRQLEYYMMDNSTRIKTTPSGTVKRWWLRSPNSYYAEKFYNVYIDGSASNNNADINNGVAPVFRILD